MWNTQRLIPKNIKKLEKWVCDSMGYRYAAYETDDGGFYIDKGYGEEEGDMGDYLIYYEDTKEFRIVKKRKF